MSYTNEYTEDFTTGNQNGNYFYYLVNGGGDPGTPCGSVNAGPNQDDKYIKSVFTTANPLFFDPNHYYPGSGWLNLAMVVYFADSGGPLPFVSDITNYRMTWRLRAKNLYLPPRARMVQWIQGHYPPSGVNVNYERVVGTIGEQLGFGGSAGRNVVTGVADSGWVDCTTHFRPLDSEWRCMGANPTRVGVPSSGNSTIYGCAPTVSDFFGSTKSATKIDTGIFFIFGNAEPYDTAPSEAVTGELWCSNVTLDRWS